MMQKIGLVGGLSWVSTLEYYRCINELAREARGGHFSADIALESIDEGRFLAAQHADPQERECAALIASAVDRVQGSGACVVALCANGLHRFVDDLALLEGTTLVNIAEATAKAVQKAGCSRVGLLGVKATMQGNFYRAALATKGIEVVVPSLEVQEEVHRIIIDELVMNHFSEATAAQMREIVADLDAEAVILGCTEIPLLLPEREVGGKALFATTEIHCREIVRQALL
ncbi:amino acid racemase [Cardiobacteriaceae bacterium TAE3-ERU3]|nr:amino acid racemase [Cardiobacteriaceae bacterium TAE3-ERU3]